MARKLPSISIVTPSYNQAQFIEATIRSVLEQGYDKLEYQVMDGGSSDGTREILERYGEHLRFVSQKDGGQSAALNEGFRLTRGEIVGWINSDDYYAPGALLTVGEYFAAHPEVEWLFGRCPIVDADGNEQKVWITRYKEYWMRRYSYRRYMIENFICQPAVFFRRRLLERVGLIDENYHCAMDYHLFLRMATAAEPAFLDRVLAHFRITGDGKTSQNFRLSFQEELDAAKRVADGKHPLLIGLHEINRVKLVTAYTLLDALAKGRG